MAKFFYGLVIVMAFAFAGVKTDGSIDLGDSDFVSKMETFDTALVMFYAPWYG